MQLFESLRQVVAAEGRAVVLVSHKLDEVLHATDDISIMRQGEVVDRLLDRATPTLPRSPGAWSAVRSRCAPRRAALGVLGRRRRRSRTAKIADASHDDDAADAASVAPCSGSTVRRARGPGGVSRPRRPLARAPRRRDRRRRRASRATANGQLGDLLSSLLATRPGDVEVDGVDRAGRPFRGDGPRRHRRHPRGPSRQRHRARHDARREPRARRPVGRRAARRHRPRRARRVRAGR